MQIRLALAILAGKASGRLLKMVGFGGGALPGLIALRIEPHLLSLLASRCSRGVVLVTGTNGKTTTSRMLAALLASDGPVVHNRSGSNLLRGQAAAFLERCSWTGHLKAAWAILEVDEAAFPTVLHQTHPRLVILHNLFRDQLDRYGEVDSIATYWKQALTRNLPTSCTLLVDADDPNLAQLAVSLHHPRTLFYGLNDSSAGTPLPTSAVDAYLSPISGKPLQYHSYYLSHLGDYTDPERNFSRPSLDYQATAINLSEDNTSFTLQWSAETLSCNLPLPGIYNLYNAVAAAAAGLQLGHTPAEVKETLTSFQGVFGRFERLTISGRQVTLCLIKNPAGASEVVRTIAHTTDPLDIALLANDNFADGLDVSWYWDAGFEPLIPMLGHLTCGGRRSRDIALRLKYAGFTGPLHLHDSIPQAFDRFLTTASSTHLYVLSTYTATLELQRHLRRRGDKSSHWHE